MKFTCDKSTILREVSLAQDIISSKNTLSILSNILLESENNKLVIKASDLKVHFETQIPVDTKEAGTTTVYCDKFLNILRALPEGEVEFNQTAEQTFYIKPLFKKIDFQLKTVSSDKYPEITDIDNSA